MTGLLCTQPTCGCYWFALAQSLVTREAGLGSLWIHSVDAWIYARKTFFRLFPQQRATGTAASWSIPIAHKWSWVFTPGIGTPNFLLFQFTPSEKWLEFTETSHNHMLCLWQIMRAKDVRGQKTCLNNVWHKNQWSGHLISLHSSLGSTAQQNSEGESSEQ